MRGTISMMALWEKAIKPTLLDFNGEALVCSNSNGKNPDNFFYNICTDPKYGFKEFHATTLDNPLLPKRLSAESDSTWAARRAKVLTALKKDNDPLVYAQEYEAEFVDWSGVAFFAREKLLQDGQPVPYPKHCDTVFAVIDTASKTGTENDGAAVAFFAHNKYTGIPLMIPQVGHRSNRRGAARKMAALSVRAHGRYIAPLWRSRRVRGRTDREQKFRNNSSSAVNAAASTGRGDRIEADGDGQGRKSDPTRPGMFIKGKLSTPSTPTISPCPTSIR